VVVYTFNERRVGAELSVSPRLVLAWGVLKVRDATEFIQQSKMPLSSKLDRKLRAAEESSDGEEYYEVTDRSSSPSVIETGEGGQILASEEEPEESNGNDDDTEEEPEAGEQVMESFGMQCIRCVR